MEYEILEESKNEIKLELLDEEHTMGNLLKSSFIKDERVKVASYDMDHPTMSNPVLHIEVKEGEDIEDVINDKTDSLIEEFKDLKNQL
ncbi:DNA-directed RNA polymerase subunit L [archaeon SCG-AAA382B04]|nr:DNA-directed RNA polymerase subunit L [archaeon SCG-AAA382B04]